MSHWTIFLPCLLGFALLALAMDRHQEDLFGRALPALTTRGLRASGWTALLVGLAFAVSGQGWALGLVSYSGHTSLCAWLVFGALVVLQRRKSRS